MRTTLDVDDDVLLAVKEIAATHGRTAGKVLSDLARKAMTPPRVRQSRNGVPLLPRRPGGSVKRTLQQVNALRDEV